MISVWPLSTSAALEQFHAVLWTLLTQAPFDGIYLPDSALSSSWSGIRSRYFLSAFPRVWRVKWRSYSQ